MKDERKTKAQLIEELKALRAQAATSAAAPPAPDQALLRGLVDLMLEPTVFIDPEGKLLYGNALAAEVVGVDTPEQLQGLDLGALVHPDSIEQVIADLAEVMNSDAPFFGNYKLLIHGRTVHIESHGTKIELTDGAVDLVSFRDVTERRVEEERGQANELMLQSVLDHSSTVIFVKDIDGRYLLINKRFEELFGIDDDEIIGKTDFDIFPPDAAELFQAKDRAAIAAGGPIEEEEIVPHADGEHAYISVKFPLFDKAGEPFATCGIATDITERKRAEQELVAIRTQLEERVAERTAKLEASEEMFRALTESMHAMVLIASLTEQRAIYVNPAATALTGYSFEELTAYPAPDMFSEATKQETLRQQAAYLRGEPLPDRMEVEVITKDGQMRWLESSVALIEIGQTGMHKVVTSFDITDRKKAEISVRESEKKFRALAESTAAQITVMQDDHYVYANQAFLDYYGMDPEELELITVEDLGMGMMKPGTVQTATEAWQAATERGENHFRFEFQDTTGHWFQTNVTTVELDGKESYLAMTIDIDELKRAQEELRESGERYRTIFETAGTAMISFGEDSVITLCNEGWADLTGFSIEETVGQKTWIPFFTEESLARMKHYHELRTKDPAAAPKAYEAQVIGRDGEIHDGIINIQVVPGTQQRVASFQDLTALKRAQSEMYRADKMAALGQIIAGVAHEINNPNNFIYFNLPILRRYIEAIRPMLEHHLDDDPELKILNMPYAVFLEDVFKLLDNMEHGSERITNIVSELKTYVRSDEEAGTKTGALGPVIDRVMALVGKQVRKMVKNFEVEVAEGLPPLKMNEGKIEQVLINLVINAGQAADKDDSWVRLTARPDPAQAAKWIEIRVEDNGTGVPDDIRDQIFEPFFTSKGRDAGTGLGLSISHRIVEEHGGTIAVDSTPGQGTAFTIRLPAAHD